MKRAIASMAMVLSVLAGPARAADVLFPDNLSFEKSWLTPNISTLGVGVEGGYRWNERWGGRVGINGLSANFTYHDKDADLINKLMLLNAGVTADYYPFAGDFRVSGGVRLSANKIDGKLRNLTKRGKNFTVIIDDPLTNYTVRQNAIQPYLGAGYSVQLQQRVSLNFDFGALYAGSPELSVRSQAEQFGFTRHQINREIERQRNRLAPFQVYPVVQIGLTVKF